MPLKNVSAITVQHNQCTTKMEKKKGQLCITSGFSQSFLFYSTYDMILDSLEYFWSVSTLNTSDRRPWPCGDGQRDSSVVLLSGVKKAIRTITSPIRILGLTYLRRSWSLIIRIQRIALKEWPLEVLQSSSIPSRFRNDKLSLIVTSDVWSDNGHKGGLTSSKIVKSFLWKKEMGWDLIWKLFIKYRKVDINT